jgi:predicted Holliday junction resolvase-like endonuclease
MRYAKRIDANQAEIIKAFEALHCQVCIIGQPVDLIVYMRLNGVWQNVLVEIKDGSKPKSAQKLTRQQIEFFDSWRGAKLVIRSVDDVIASLRA